MSTENNRRELITELADAVTEIMQRYGGESETTVQRGTPTTISYQGELDDGEPIELVVAISSDLDEELTPADTFGGVIDRARTDRGSSERVETTGAITAGDTISSEAVADSRILARTPDELERVLKQLNER